MHRHRIGLAFAIVALLALTASAQRDAGAKARGDFSFYARSGYSHVNAAHDHASHYEDYLGDSAGVSPRVVRMSGSTIGHHLDLTQQNVDAMREQFVAQDDAESIATLDTIDDHLADARKHHAAAQALATGSPADPAQARKSVQSLQDSLEKVRDLQQSILDRHDVTLQPAPAE